VLDRTVPGNCLAKSQVLAGAISIPDHFKEVDTDSFDAHFDGRTCRPQPGSEPRHDRKVDDV
jgi:hypothetical protein